jgi:TusA-related sulfurtransferase
MGATTWQYFVPYQQDVSKALEELREETFRTGAYEIPYGIEEAGIEKPESIEQLLEAAAEEGTHSILDIYQVSSSPDFGSITPLPPEAILQIFATSTPTHEQIEAAAERGSFEEYVQRWQGIYIRVFQNDTPSELFFWGYSGD